MTTHEEVLAALYALIVSALPGADVSRNKDAPTRIGPGGWAGFYDGDPGDPYMDLSPPVYNWQRSSPLRVLPPAGAPNPEAFAYEMLAAVADKIEADRTLGGRCSYIDADAPTLDMGGLPGTATVYEMNSALMAEYATSSPLR